MGFKRNTDRRQKFTAAVLLNKAPTALDSANKTLRLNLKLWKVMPTYGRMWSKLYLRDLFPCYVLNKRF